MSIVSVRQVGEGRSSDEDDQGVKRASLHFIVRTDSTLDGAATVRTALTLPRIGDPYIEPNGSIDASMRCKKVSAKQQSNNWRLWDVDADFDSAPRDAQDRERQEPNPVLRPIRRSFSSEKKEHAVEKDVDGEPIVNTAGDPFDPPLTETRVHLVMNVEKNIPVFNPQAIRFYVNSTNNDDWYGWEPRTVLLDDLTADESEENNYTFWKVKFKFVFTVEGEFWETVVLNTGTNEIIYDTNGDFVVKQSVHDARTKQAKTKPVPLDANGTSIDAEDLLAGTVEPHYLKFQIIKRRAFSGLGL